MKAASNIAASAKAGMDKTKAVVQEKVEKAKTRDPLQKQLAEEKKEAKIHEAEHMKLGTQAANKHSTAGGLTHGVTTGGLGTGTTTGGLGGHLPSTDHTGVHHPTTTTTAGDLGTHLPGTGHTGVHHPTTTGGLGAHLPGTGHTGKHHHGV